MVAEEVAARHEGLVGAYRDPTFGPVVVVGAGGKYVEALPDSPVVLAPVDAGRARRAIEGLRLAAVLGGVRGDPPVDVDAFADVAVRVGELLAQHDEIVSVDANPVLLSPDGAVVVDALVERRAP